MSFNIYTTDFFEKELKKLSKKHSSVKNDYKVLIENLKKNQNKDNHLVKIAIK